MCGHSSIYHYYRSIMGLNISSPPLPSVPTPTFHLLILISLIKRFLCQIPEHLPPESYLANSLVPSPTILAPLHLFSYLHLPTPLYPNSVALLSLPSPPFFPFHPFSLPFSHPFSFFSPTPSPSLPPRCVPLEARAAPSSDSRPLSSAEPEPHTLPGSFREVS